MINEMVSQILVHTLFKILLSVEFIFNDCTSENLGIDVAWHLVPISDGLAANMSVRLCITGVVVVVPMSILHNLQFHGFLRLKSNVQLQHKDAITMS